MSEVSNPLEFPDDLQRNTESSNDSSQCTQQHTDAKIGSDEVLQINPYKQPIWFQAAILMSISFLSFGSYFAYDAVSALEADIREISTAQFGLLSSVYSFPNIILVLVGGFLIDKIGNRTSAILFCALIAIGAAFVAIAPAFKSFYVMLLGRFIFGLGSESSYEWFSGRHLAVAMGVSLSVSRLGSVLAFSTEAAIGEYFESYQVALWTAFTFTILSLVFVFIYFTLDKQAKKIIKVTPQKPSKTPCLDIRAFSSQYWLCTIIIVCIYTTIFSFRIISSDEISIKYHWTSEQAGLLLSSIDLMSLFLSPLVGLLADYTGKIGYLVLIGNLLAVFGYFTLGLTYWSPVLGTIFLACHFCIVSSTLWPCISLLVSNHQIGLAFAITSAAINAALTGITPLAGYLTDKYGLKGICVLFGGISSFSVMIAIIWNIRDYKSRIPILNVKKEQKEYMELSH